MNTNRLKSLDKAPNNPYTDLLFNCFSLIINILTCRIRFRTGVLSTLQARYFYHLHTRHLVRKQPLYAQINVEKYLNL